MMDLNIIPKGTEKVQKCYDGKIHTLAVCDYIIRIKGETYKNKEFLKNRGCRWNSDYKCWDKSVDYESEIEDFYNTINNKGLYIDSVKSVFRIMN